MAASRYEANSTFVFLALSILAIATRAVVTEPTTQCCFESDCAKDAPQYNASYCCGNATVRVCCADASLDFWALYESTAKCTCGQSSCVHAAWLSVLWFFLLVVFIFIFLLCCLFAYACFTRMRCPGRDLGNDVTLVNRTHRGSTRLPTVSGSLSDDLAPHYRQDAFDPRHRFAFTPPDYETACKDLPTYDDLEASARQGDAEVLPNAGFTGDGRGLSNAGFTGDSGGLLDGTLTGDSEGLPNAGFTGHPGRLPNAGFTGDTRAGMREEALDGGAIGGGRARRDEGRVPGSDVRELIHTESPPPPYRVDGTVQDFVIRG